MNNRIEFLSTLASLEICSPPLIKIGNKNYRHLQVDLNVKHISNSNNLPEMNSFVDYRTHNELNYHESLDIINKIDFDESDQKLIIQKVVIAKPFHKYIEGHHSSQRMKIESETKTKILIPRIDDISEIITIQGYLLNAIQSSKNRIDIIVETNRKYMEMTHFISIPLNCPEIMRNFETLKRYIAELSIKDIDSSIFQRSSRLHLTLGVLKLLSNRDLEMATSFMKHDVKILFEKFFEAKLPYLTLSSLRYMNDDPQEVNILYTDIESDQIDSFKNFCNELVEIFVNKGLMQPSRSLNNSVKLHVTLINTKWRKTIALQQNTIEFNASTILEHYSSFRLGSTCLKELHLSRMNKIDSYTDYFFADFILKL